MRRRPRAECRARRSHAQLSETAGPCCSTDGRGGLVRRPLASEHRDDAVTERGRVFPCQHGDAPCREGEAVLLEVIQRRGAWSSMCSATASTTNPWFCRSSPAETRQKIRKFAVNPRPFGISCARTQRCEVARRTTVAGSRRSRRAHSSASTLVGSDTTSVPRSADNTLFWLAWPMREQTPRGATGDSSIDSKAAAAPADAGRLQRGSADRRSPAGQNGRDPIARRVLPHRRPAARASATSSSSDHRRDAGSPRVSAS